MEVLVPFAVGALLPSVFLGFKTAEENLCFGLSLAAGEFVVLLFALKLRAAYVRLRPDARPWWVHLIGGVANTTAMLVVLFQITYRNWQWPMVGEGGSIIAVLILAVTMAVLLAMFLAPAERTSS